MLALTALLIALALVYASLFPFRLHAPAGIDAPHPLTPHQVRPGKDLVERDCDAFISKMQKEALELEKPYTLTIVAPTPTPPRTHPRSRK